MFTKFSVFLKRVSLLNRRDRTNFVAFPLERTRKEPQVRFDFGPRPGFSKQLFGSSREGTKLDWTYFKQFLLHLCRNLSKCGRRDKTPTPKTRFSSWTLLRTPGRFTTRPLPVHFTTKMSVVRPFSVLSKDEIGLSKTAVVLVRLKSWGRRSFPPVQGLLTLLDSFWRSVLRGPFPQLTLLLSANFRPLNHRKTGIFKEARIEISSETKGPGVPSIGVMGISALDIDQFLRRNVWMISFSPGPFVLLQMKEQFVQTSASELFLFFDCLRLGSQEESLGK